jgi:hypothetical protein
MEPLARGLTGESIMKNYQQKISPWTIVRLQGEVQHSTVARFRRRGDAEGHLSALKRMMPKAEFAIVYDCPRDATV